MRSRVFLLSLISLTACSPKSENGQLLREKNNQTNEKAHSAIATESFNKFFEKFSVDSAYQQSRIVFPLPVEAYDIDAEGFISSKMDSKEWGYMDFQLEKPYVIKVNAKESSDTVKVNFQKEETGIYTDYLFTIINGKWMLVKVLDQST